jgi:hypothetical protein
LSILSNSNLPFLGNLFIDYATLSTFKVLLGEVFGTCLLGLLGGRGRMCDNSHMSQRRIILLGLLVPSVKILTAGIIWPDVSLEYLCYVYAVPVMVLEEV